MRNLLTLFLLLALFQSAARAEFIETQALQSVCVIRARIDSVTPTGICPATSQPRALLHCTALEVLKQPAGPPLHHFEAIADSFPSVNDANRFAAARSELLLFLDPPHQDAAVDAYWVESFYVTANLPPDDSGDRLMPTDLHCRPLSTPADLLAATRAELARTPQAKLLPLHFITNQIDFIPLDERLPALINEWAASGEPGIRKFAAKVLANLPPMPEHIALLKSLLHDPYFYVPRDNLSPWSIKIFPVRSAAARALRQLQTKPYVVEPELGANLYRPVHIYLWTGLAVLLLIVFFQIRYRIRRRYHLPAPSLLNRLFVLPAFLFLMIAVVAGVCWIRSYSVADDFYRSSGDDLVNVASCRGGILFQRTYNFHVLFTQYHPTPLVHCAANPDLSLVEVVHFAGNSEIFGIAPSNHTVLLSHLGTSQFGPSFISAPEPLANPTALFYQADFPYPPDLVSGEFEPLHSLILILPYRYIFFATVPLPLIYFFAVALTLLVRKRRTDSAHCPVCNYDLRSQVEAHIPRCPECGTTPPLIDPKT